MGEKNSMDLAAFLRAAKTDKRSDIEKIKEIYF
jgi:hypothetical protein